MTLPARQLRLDIALQNCYLSGDDQLSALDLRLDIVLLDELAIQR